MEKNVQVLLITKGVNILQLLHLAKNSDNQESGDFNFKQCPKDIIQNNFNHPVLG